MSDIEKGERPLFKNQVVLVACAFLLNACGIIHKERIAGYKKDCLAYGFQEGTKELAQCVMKLQQSYEARRMEEQQARQAARDRRIDRLLESNRTTQENLTFGRNRSKGISCESEKRFGRIHTNCR